MSIFSILKKALILSLVLLFLWAAPGITFLFVSLINGGGDRTFSDQYIEAVLQANQVLVQHNICKSVDVCRGEIIFVKPASGGFEASTYGITNPVVLGEITQVFVKTFYDTPSMKQITIKAYAFPKKDDYSIPFPPIPITKWKEGTIVTVNIHR